MTDAPPADRVVAAVTDLKKLEKIPAETPYWVEEVIGSGFTVWFHRDAGPVAYEVNLHDETGTITSWSRPIIAAPAPEGWCARLRRWLGRFGN